MKRVGIYGGAFNPVHVGHKHVVNYILKENIVDEVWIVPSYRHFHGKQMASHSDRCMMCELMFADMDKVRLLDIDSVFSYIYPEYDGSTIEFMKHLRKAVDKDPQDFYIIIGQDNAEHMDTWNRGGELIQNEKFITVPRKYESESELKGNEWYLNEPHKYLMRVPCFNASSSEVRHLFSLVNENGVDDRLKALLGHDVLAYTQHNKLYME